MTTIPTLKSIYDDIIADYNAEFGININPFGKAFLRAWAAVRASKMKLQYYVLGNLQKNIWVDTADPVSVGGTLERFGFTFLGRYPFPATQGQYACTVTGTAAAVVPALTTFKSDNSSKNPNFLFILDTAYTMPGSSGTITLRALTPGTVSSLLINDTLTATSPIVNVNGIATVASVAVSPIDAETTEQYRQKALEAVRLSPQGGSSADYRLWAGDAAGVRQSYPYVQSGASCVIDLYVEAILADSVGPPLKGVPTPAILAEVAADIVADPVTGKARKPLGVFLVNTIAISPQTVTIQIDSGGTITAAQQALITPALIAACYNIRPFIPGADIAADRNDTLSTFGIGNVIIETIGGIVISAITLTVGGGGSITSYLFDNGEIPYLAAIDVTYI